MMKIKELQSYMLDRKSCISSEFIDECFAAIVQEETHKLPIIALFPKETIKQILGAGCLSLLNLELFDGMEYWGLSPNGHFQLGSRHFSFKRCIDSEAVCSVEF